VDECKPLDGGARNTVRVAVGAGAGVLGAGRACRSAHYPNMTKCVKGLRAKQNKAKHGPNTGSDQAASESGIDPCFARLCFSRNTLTHLVCIACLTIKPDKTQNRCSPWLKLSALTWLGRRFRVQATDLKRTTDRVHGPGA